jgi:hypothetical protein
MMVLLLAGAIRQQQFRHDGMPTHRPGQAHPTARQLLGDQRIARSRHVGSTPRFGDRQPVNAELLHLLDELLGVGVGVFQLPEDGFDVPVDEAADQLNDLGLFFAEVLHDHHLGSQ